MPASQNSTRPPVSPGPLRTRGASCLAQNRPGWSGWLREARIRKKDLFFIIQLVYPTHNKTGPDCSQMLDGARERDPTGPRGLFRNAQSLGNVERDGSPL